MTPGTDAAARRRRIGAVCVLGSAVAFAVAPIFGKVAYAHGIDAFALLALRFSSAALILWLLVLVQHVRAGVRAPDRRTALRVLALGALVLPAEVILYFSSLHHIGAGLAEVLLFLYPMWVVLITAVVLRTPVSRIVVLCSAGAVGGAALTVGAVEGVDLVGVVLAVGASIGFACYVVLSGRLVHGMGALVTTAVVLGAVLLGEQVGLLQTVGVVVVLASVAVLLRRQSGTDPAPPTLEH